MTIRSWALEERWDKKVPPPGSGSKRDRCAARELRWNKKWPPPGSGGLVKEGGVRLPSCRLGCRAHPEDGASDVLVRGENHCVTIQIGSEDDRAMDGA